MKTRPVRLRAIVDMSMNVPADLNFPPRTELDSKLLVETKKEFLRQLIFFSGTTLFDMVLDGIPIDIVEVKKI